MLNGFILLQPGQSVATIQKPDGSRHTLMKTRGCVLVLFFVPKKVIDDLLQKNQHNLVDQLKYTLFIGEN